MAESNPEGGQSVEALILEEKLAKIRTQVNSKLDNQKNLALIYTAVGENITEQGNEKTSVAYFTSDQFLVSAAFDGFNASWLAVVAKGTESFAKVSPELCNTENPETGPRAEYSITPEIYEKVDDMITTIAEYIEKELFTIIIQHATRVILEFLTAAVLKLGSRTNPDFLAILRTVGEWRSNEDM
ncbi:pre-rRNA processing protein [Candidozyma auris]